MLVSGLVNQFYLSSSSCSSGIGSWCCIDPAFSSNSFSRSYFIILYFVFGCNQYLKQVLSL